MTGRMRIFSYHEGIKRDWRALCAESWERHHPGCATLYDRAGFEEAYKADTGAEPAWGNWLPAQRSAFVCAYSLCRDGGAWIEPDTVLFRPLTPYTTALSHFDFIAPYPAYVATASDPCLLLSRADGYMISRFLAAVRKHLDQGLASFNTVYPMRWLDGILVAATPRAPIMKIPGKLVRSIQTVQMYTQAPVKDTDEAHAKKLPTNALAFALGYSVSGAMMQWDREKLLASDTFFGYLLRRGIGV